VPDPAASASGTPGPAARPPRAAVDQASCKKHGPGAVWRLAGTLGGQPVTGDAILVNRSLRLVVAGKSHRGSLLEGTIDERGGFEAQGKGSELLSVKGQLDARGRLTAAAQRATGEAAPLAMTGTRLRPGTQPLIVPGYTVVTGDEAGEASGEPTRRVANAQLVIAPGGEVSVVHEEVTLARGPCLPGAPRREGGAGAWTRAEVKAAAAGQIPGSRVVASEVFEGSCERGWSFLDVIVLAERDEYEELITIRLSEAEGRAGELLGSAELASRRPYPPRCK
jgi:hypothetical protein